MIIKGIDKRVGLFLFTGTRSPSHSAPGSAPSGKQASEEILEESKELLLNLINPNSRKKCHRVTLFSISEEKGQGDRRGLEGVQKGTEDKLLVGRDKAGFDGGIEAALHNLFGHTFEIEQTLNVFLRSDNRCSGILAQD